MELEKVASCIDTNLTSCPLKWPGKTWLNKLQIKQFFIVKASLTKRQDTIKALIGDSYQLSRPQDPCDLRWYKWPWPGSSYHCVLDPIAAGSMLPNNQKSLRIFYTLIYVLAPNLPGTYPLLLPLVLHVNHKEARWLSDEVPLHALHTDHLVSRPCQTEGTPGGECGPTGPNFFWPGHIFWRVVGIFFWNF